MTTTNMTAAVGVLAALGACSDATNQETALPADAGGADTRPAPDTSAEITLGDDHYQLNFATCVAEENGAVWIAASDEQKRAELPSIRIRYFPDRTVAPPVFSVEFQLADPRVLWRLESGSIAPTTMGHEASGIMYATEMTDDERGRLMVRMDDSHNREFTLKVRC